MAVAAVLFVIGLFISPAARAQSQPIPAGLINSQAASVVVGQQNFSDITPGTDSERWGSISGFVVVGNRLIVADSLYLVGPGEPNNNRLWIFNDLQGLLNRRPQDPLPNADVIVGQPTHVSSEPGTSATQMFQPAGLASDGTRLFVAEWGNNRVLIYNTIPETDGAAANVVVGQQSFTTNGFGAGASSLRRPNGVASDGTRLFIADTLNNRVLIYNSIPTSNGASADVVVGQPNFAAFQAGPTAANTLSRPMSATTDGQRLIITDLENNRVLIYNSIPTASGAAADVVIGQPDFSSNGFGTGPASLNFPRYAFSDGTRLAVVDSGNNRILIYNSIPTTNGAAADVVLGQLDFASHLESCGAANLAVPFMAAAVDGTLLVSDAFNRRILGFRPGADFIKGVVNGASFSAQPQVAACNVITLHPPVSPGGIASIFGTNLANSTEQASSLPLPTQMGGVRVLVNGFEAPLYYVSPTQLNVQVPYEVTGFSASMEIERQIGGQVVRSAAFPAGLANGAPGIFTHDFNPSGRGIITHADFSLVTDDNPALPGETLIVFVTGLGRADPPMDTGVEVRFPAAGAVSLSGVVTAGDVVTINVNGRDHSYTTTSEDILQTIMNGLVEIIERDDPEVTAVGDVENLFIRIRARVPGPTGENISYSGFSSEGSQIGVAAEGTGFVPGAVTFGGTVEPGHRVVIGLAGTEWDYITQPGDTLDSVITTMADMIENGDPNVGAFADLNRRAVFLFMRDPGSGLGIPYGTAVSDGAPFFTSSAVQFLRPTVAEAVNRVSAQFGETLPLVPADILFGGTPEPGQTLTVSLAEVPYSYTAVPGETLQSFVTNLAAVIDGDPNVAATGDTTNLAVLLRLRDATSTAEIPVRTEISGGGSLFFLVTALETTDSLQVGVNFAGPVEGFAGLEQVNFVVPSDAAPDPAAKLTIFQNQIILGSISQFNIFSNTVTFPIGSPPE